MQQLIVCIGELVWDIFPERQVLGGAPVNVAYHLGCLGLPVRLLSKVGADHLGRQALVQLRTLGVPTEAIQVDEDLATGEVRVTVSNHNEPRFEIVAPAAWDNIDGQIAEAQVGQEEFVLVFGTLAQRDPRSRAVIRRLWEQAEFCFYDVNLRPPFTTKELVADSLHAARMVKVNEPELLILAAWFQIDLPDKIEIATELREMFELEVVVVTEGAAGAWLLDGDEYYAESGSQVMVADTVGAGDAFFATVIEGFLLRRPWAETLKRANRRGGYVASRHGATPPMPEL